ncbi:tRNA-intron lyase [Candidatus Woesearchaeota archaeon]|nr:MAG: tRNA-intron lyase [Candidatus Woesearchaeota archaeon]
MPAAKKKATTKKKTSKSSEKKENKETSKQTTKKKEPAKAHWAVHRVITENSDAARDLYHQNRFGSLLEDGKVQLSLLEALYLLEKGKLIILDGRNQPFTTERYLKRAIKEEPDFWVRYMVYKDIRNRGYIIKTALKFGADFRIYDRGVKPGEDHARWVVFPVHEGETLTWHEFAAKNRVAHSTKKRLMLGVVDDEGDVSYWEVRWMRP